MNFIWSLSDEAYCGRPASLAIRIYQLAVTDRRSRLKALTTTCQAYLDSRRLETALTAAFRRVKGEPRDERIALLIRVRAQNVTLRVLAWRKHEPEQKLLKLQTQDYAQPHPVAYLADPDAVMVGRWLVNHIPGSVYPCTHCNGEYTVSRYHMARCTDVRVLLGRFSVPEAYAEYFSLVDTVPDAMILDLVPPDLRREQILAGLNCCPGLPRVRSRPPANAGRNGGERRPAAASVATAAYGESAAAMARYRLAATSRRSREGHRRIMAIMSPARPGPGPSPWPTTRGIGITA